MPRIGLISDTHGHLDPNVFKHFADCDEIWHAGDFGTAAVSEELAAFKPLKGVYGNIDGREVRLIHPLELRFECAGADVLITHIAGSPPRFLPDFRKKIENNPPKILVCGHSHILRVETIPAFNNMLYINPGAAGRYGFHKVRTVLKFDINAGKVSEMKAVELGARGELT